MCIVSESRRLGREKGDAALFQKRGRSSFLIDGTQFAPLPYFPCLDFPEMLPAAWSITSSIEA